VEDLDSPKEKTANGLSDARGFPLRSLGPENYGGQDGAAGNE
jgi:hypothetical protein